MPEETPDGSLYDTETPEEDLWFLPGAPEDVDPTLPPLPHADRVQLPDADAWRAAESRQGRGLAEAAAEVARLDQAVKGWERVVGGDGVAHRLALQEAAWGEADFELSAILQPMSLHFRIGNVHIGADTRDQCSAVLIQAHEHGELGLYGGPWIGRISDTEVYVNACRAPGSGIVPDDLTRAEMQGREDAKLMFDPFKGHVSGFEDSFLASTGPVVGVRESRRITGDTVLTREDITNEVRSEDVVALGAWWLDRHPVDQAGYHIHEMVRPYDIGYGTLLPKKLSNVWVAGRCHSADSIALSSSRVTVTAMGEAAGLAAAMCAQQSEDSRSLKISALQDQLLADGAIILDRAEKIRAIGDAVENKPVSAIR